MTELPGKALAQELIDKSREEISAAPITSVIEAARNGALSEPAIARLIGRLWTLERMFYYVYGGWGQGLEMNDFPPSIKYLFSKQIVDESTHEMLYLDALLKRGIITRQKDAFHQPYGRFTVDFGAGLLCFLAAQPRNLSASDPHCGTQPRPQGHRVWLDGGIGGS